MELVRVGDKMLSRPKLYRVVDKILELRAGGLSQLEVAERVGIDRTFVSRLESLGEVRKGKKIALVGFPVANAAELRALAADEGLDFALLFNDQERWEWAGAKGGVEMINELMAVITRLRECDAVILIGSDMRLNLAEAIVGPQLIGIQIGTSPITEDKSIDVDVVRNLIRNLKE